METASSAGNEEGQEEWDLEVRLEIYHELIPCSESVSLRLPHRASALRFRYELPLRASAFHFRSALPLRASAPRFRSALLFPASTPLFRSLLPLRASTPRFRSVLPLPASALRFRSQLPLSASAPLFRSLLLLSASNPRFRFAVFALRFRSALLLAPPLSTFIFPSTSIFPFGLTTYEDSLYY